jgi:hypothetical protein
VESLTRVVLRSRVEPSSLDHTPVTLQPSGH